MFKYILSAILVCVLAFSNVSLAEKGDFDLSLSGLGVSDKNLENTSLSLSVAPGYFLTNEVEVGLRQSVTFVEVDGDSSSVWNGSTSVFVDYFFDLEKWQPFVGLSTGYNYGDTTVEGWVGGPEAGLQYFVNDTTYVYGMAQYLFDLEEGADDGTFVYGFGVGFLF